MTREPPARSYLLQGHSFQAPKLEAGLYLVATPIGNLRDISLRALETLAASDVIACEDTRVSRRLTEHYGIRRPFLPYHEHNAAQARPKLLARIAAGDVIALVSDAGTPLISDPGYKLVREAREAEHLVTALPGASATLAALTSAGLPTDRFFFEGFLPPKSGQRRDRIAKLAHMPATLILFETGPRLAASLADLAEHFGEREAAICRELTKLHEEIRRGSLPELAQAYTSDDTERRGEFVLVIAPPPDDKQDTDADSLDDMIRAALQRVSVKDAVAEVSTATGMARRDVYQRALALEKEIKK